MQAIVYHLKILSWIQHSITKTVTNLNVPSSSWQLEVNGFSIGKWPWYSIMGV